MVYNNTLAKSGHIAENYFNAVLLLLENYKSPPNYSIHHNQTAIWESL